MVRENWIKPGAVIIDVGINPVEVRILCHWFVIPFFLLFPRLLSLPLSSNGHSQILVFTPLISKLYEFSQLRRYRLCLVLDIL